MLNNSGPVECEINYKVRNVNTLEWKSSEWTRHKNAFHVKADMAIKRRPIAHAHCTRPPCSSLFLLQFVLLFEAQKRPEAETLPCPDYTDRYGNVHELIPSVVSRGC